MAARMGMVLVSFVGPVSGLLPAPHIRVCWVDSSQQLAQVYNMPFAFLKKGSCLPVDILTSLYSPTFSRFTWSAMAAASTGHGSSCSLPCAAGASAILANANGATATLGFLFNTQPGPVAVEQGQLMGVNGLLHSHSLFPVLQTLSACSPRVGGQPPPLVPRPQQACWPSTWSCAWQPCC